VASSPSRKGEIELEIRYVLNGICTTWVHQYLKTGDRILLNGPYGEFHLRESDRKIVCVAGGSGMAPIKSILSAMAESGNGRETVYFFGAKAKRDLFLQDQMTDLEKRLKNFRFVPALSSPMPEDNWTGETGLITDVLARNLASGENTEAYLCGSPGMIEACIKVLKSKGIPDSLIFYDKFS
jgi:Na+-transporting NADH:ubiquinone oxidoreductase subunit F